MKVFRYNDVGYTIYNANELKEFPHPCVLDDMGNCPYGYQKTILNSMLQ